jgi:hypothetical protein
VIALALLLTAAPSTTRERLLVLEPRGTSVDDELKQLLVSTLTIELSRHSEYEVLSSTDVKQLADLEAERINSGCDTSGCLTEIADALGARYVVIGDVAELGDVIVVNLSLFDVKLGSAVARTSVDVNDKSELPAKVREAANALLPGRRDGVPTWALVVGGVGLGIGVTGMTFDALSPTSQNGVVDAFDMIGPACLIAGVAAVVAAGIGGFAGDEP